MQPRRMEASSGAPRKSNLPMIIPASSTGNIQREARRSTMIASKLPSNRAMAVRSRMLGSEPTKAFAEREKADEAPGNEQDDVTDNVATGSHQLPVGEQATHGLRRHRRKIERIERAVGDEHGGEAKKQVGYHVAQTSTLRITIEPARMTPANHLRNPFTDDGPGPIPVPMIR